MSKNEFRKMYPGVVYDFGMSLQYGLISFLIWAHGYSYAVPKYKLRIIPIVLLVALASCTPAPQPPAQVIEQASHYNGYMCIYSTNTQKIILDTCNKYAVGQQISSNVHSRPEAYKYYLK